jgi:catechol 2,3-dioxygenase-like lactoylglutathione lyase family enzyme
MRKIISGIQQVGIGNPNMEKAWAWYRKNFGMDIPALIEEADADLMIDYTRDKVESRHACIAMNLNGGGGFEVWQYTSRTPEPPKLKLKLGDYGIFITKMKSADIVGTYQFLKGNDVEIISEILTDPAGNKFFFLKDLYGNLFQVEEADVWFQKPTTPQTGGSAGVIIGVSDIDNSLKLYSDILGFDKVIYDVTDKFDDLAAIPGGEERYRRILLTHSKPLKGAFSQLLGPIKIELIQALDDERQPIFKNRIWGDMGFIHLCFDIRFMDDLKNECEQAGYNFTVDSEESFDMGQAAGRFSYIEDPDGTLIEFVETHKLPVVKKLGWNFNLDGRDQEKPLPKWMLKFMSFSRKKD